VTCTQPKRENGVGLNAKPPSSHTLTAVYLAARNYLKGRTIFSNITLYGIPFYRVDSVEDIMRIKDGFFLADELFYWLDSRMIGEGARKRNKIVADILARSRKRRIIMCYTAQVLSSVDKRVRQVTDFVMIPQLNRNASICNLLIFKGYKPIPATFYKVIRFKTAPIFKLYNSNEEVPELKIEDPEPMKLEFHDIDENPALREEVH